MNKICYIFAAGDFDGDFTPDADSFIIAADAGYRHTQRLGIVPDILLGDFDTIGEIPKHKNIIRFNTDKDYTDTELALKEAIRLGYTEFVICGALGGKRLEHTLGNIALGAAYAESGYSITLTDGNTFVSPVHNSSICFDRDCSGFISVFPFYGKAENVSISGLKYDLEEAVLDSSNPTLCISNEFCGKDAVISVGKGTVIIIWQKSKN